MATKEAEVSSHEHDHPAYQGANGTSNELGRQISVTLTQAQFEGKSAVVRVYEPRR